MTDTVTHRQIDRQIDRQTDTQTNSSENITPPRFRGGVKNVLFSFTKFKYSTDVKNPNDCPAVGTFFVQSESSDLNAIKGLYDAGHEIGVTSSDGTYPDPSQWREELQSKYYLIFRL